MARPGLHWLMMSHSARLETGSTPEVGSSSRMTEESPSSAMATCKTYCAIQVGGFTINKLFARLDCLHVHRCYFIATNAPQHNSVACAGCIPSNDMDGGIEGSDQMLLWVLHIFTLLHGQ